MGNILKVNNKDTRKTSGVFIVNFEHISHVLVFILLILSKRMPAGERCIYDPVKYLWWSFFFFFFFFFYQGFLSQTLNTDDSQDSRGREGTFFYSTLPLPPAQEHSDIYLQLCMWDDCHVFLIATLVFTILLLDEMYHLIQLPFDWLMMLH